MTKNKPTAGRPRARKRGAALPERRLSLPRQGLEKVDDHYVATLEGEELERYLAVDRPARLRVIERLIQESVDKPRLELEAERRALERRKLALARDRFDQAWSHAKADIELLVAYANVEFEEGKELGNSATPDYAAAIAAYERAGGAHELRDELEVAMARATEALGALTRVHENWEAARRWAVARELARIIVDVSADALSNPASWRLHRFAQVLGVETRKLAEAVHEVRGDARTLGPVKAAERAVARATGIGERTVSRGPSRVPPKAIPFFRWLAKSDIEGPPRTGLGGLIPTPTNTLQK